MGQAAPAPLWLESPVLAMSAVVWQERALELKWELQVVQKR